jgi:hypothetical protein
MGRLLKTLGAAALAISLSAGPVVAQPAPPEGGDKRQIEESIKKSMEKILRALEGLIDSVPIYELPEVQDNGDIIIRRKKRAPAPKPGANGDSSST